MLSYRTKLIYTLTFLGAVLLASCSPNSAATPPARKATPTRTVQVSATPSPSAQPDRTPARYTARVLVRGAGRPDDLAFDPQGRLLFSDFYNGTISRVNEDGSVSVIARGLAGPEGIVALSDGTLIIAEQRTNRIVSLAPGAQMPVVLRTLPGTPSTAHCKDGVDGIALDAATQTLIIPDSPIGNVYRMSLDGNSLKLLASGIVRPVGAMVDPSGNVYVADECGGAVWRISPAGKKTRLGGFGMPDDIELDPYGNLLVIDLAPSIHALVRLRLATGRHETLASRGLIEPQGLAVDGEGHIFVADDYANVIMEYTPV